MVSRACSPAVLRPFSFLTGTNHDGIEQRFGAHGGAARRLEIGAAGGLAGVGEQYEHATAAGAAPLQRLGTEKDSIVERGAVARSDVA